MLFRSDFPLFRYGMAVVTLCYMVLSFSHPDYLIAKVNVASMDLETRSAFFQGEPYDDYQFLSHLNADAAPVLLEWMAAEGYDLNAYYLENPIQKAREAGYSSWKREGFGYSYLTRLKERNAHNRIRTFNVSRFLTESGIPTEI